jgi:hypothetical protein
MECSTLDDAALHVGQRMQNDECVLVERLHDVFHAADFKPCHHTVKNVLFSAFIISRRRVFRRDVCRTITGQRRICSSLSARAACSIAASAARPVEPTTLLTKIHE